jgi:putative ATPase
MNKLNSPLAYRLRPKELKDFFGQTHLISEGQPLKEIIESDKIPSSMIFWGPPGCGKTTIAKIISHKTNSQFISLSAVSAQKEDIRKAINQARLFAKKTILFLDEIHRFNKAQQDFLLPYVEDGTLTLIGATTENPSFEINSALLSRSKVYIFRELEEETIIKIIDRAILNENLKIILSEENKKLISNLSNGDARTALNILELCILTTKPSTEGYLEISKDTVINSSEKKLRYDKNNEEHYNIISALHKSMRDSDADASIYWTMRMIEAGEDPKYIIRRMIRFASEDIGNADPQALQLAVSAKEAVHFLGYPECNTALVQTAVYLANAPKSNAIYKAVQQASNDIKQTGNLPVPLILRNAETKFMKDIGYGEGYKYAHNFPEAKVSQQHLPDKLINKKYYFPSDKGFEKTFKQQKTD